MATKIGDEALELCEASSPWFTLPHEIAGIITDFLGDVDMCGRLNMISKLWAIRYDEFGYRKLCTVYLLQTSKKKLDVDKWKTWQNMLTFRPRLRTNGFFWLRTSYWKPPINDNFWESKKHEFCEVNSLSFLNLNVTDE